MVNSRRVWTATAALVLAGGAYWMLQPTPEAKATEIVRNAIGEDGLKFWDVKACRSEDERYVFNVSGYVTGGANGRVWLVDFEGEEPSGDIELEPETAGDLADYYQAMRDLRGDSGNCGRIVEEALYRANDLERLRSGESPKQVYDDRRAREEMYR